VNALLRPRAWWLACLLLALVYPLSAPRDWQVDGVDEIEYLSLAHSLNLGLGYTLYGEPHVYYPPLPALVFAGVMRVAGHDNFAALYAVNALIGLAAIAGFGAWLRARFGNFGVWASWLTLLSYYGWSFSTRFLLSEPLYLGLSLAALALAHDALENARRPRRTWVLLALCCLLAAMTRSASISLAGALIAAGGMHFLLRRSRRGLAVAGIALVCMVGFNAAWQVRAQHVQPQARESYLKWAKKFVGGGGPAAPDDLVARNKGEGITPEQNRWHIRSLLLADRVGQILAGCPRAPDAFRPVAVFFTLLVIAGALTELRVRPHSPMAWLVLGSLLLFSLTSWVSSYLRYLYTLLPLLFLYLLRGFRLLVSEPARRPVGVALGLVGLWGLWLGARALMHPTDTSAGVEALYQLALAIVSLLFCLVALVLGVIWFRRTFRPDPMPPPAAFLALVLAVTLTHTSVLAVQRVRLTRDGANLRAMKLDHAFACAQWVRANTAPDAWGVCAYPMLMRIACGRELRLPSDCRNPLADKPDFVLNIGLPSHVPGVPWIETECLRQAVQREEFLRGNKPVIKRGYASVLLPPAQP
jgi:hypothetical protein